MNLIKKYTNQSIMFSLVAVLYGGGGCALIFLNAIDPSITLVSDRAFILGLSSFVVFVFGVIDLTRSFTIGMMVNDLGLNQQTLEVFEKYNQEHERMLEFIEHWKITDNEVNLINEYRAALR